MCPQCAKLTWCKVKLFSSTCTRLISLYSLHFYLHLFYLPGEFASVIMTAVYIPPRLRIYYWKSCTRGQQTPVGITRYLYHHNQGLQQSQREGITSYLPTARVLQHQRCKQTQPLLYHHQGCPSLHPLLSVWKIWLVSYAPSPCI